MSSNENPTREMGSVSLWLEGMRNGDRESQNRLLERYRDKVVRYAAYRLKQLGVRSQDADDIAQTVFIGLFDRAEKGKLPDLNNREKLEIKLNGMTRDRVIDARRKRLPFTESVIDKPSDSRIQPLLQRIADFEQSGCFFDAQISLFLHFLEEKKTELRQIAEFRLQGLSCQSIAVELGMSETTVRRRPTWIAEVFKKHFNVGSMSIEGNG